MTRDECKVPYCVAPTNGSHFCSSECRVWYEKRQAEGGA